MDHGEYLVELDTCDFTALDLGWDHARFGHLLAGGRLPDFLSRPLGGFTSLIANGLVLVPWTGRIQAASNQHEQGRNSCHSQGKMKGPIPSHDMTPTMIHGRSKV